MLLVNSRQEGFAHVLQDTPQYNGKPRQDGLSGDLLQKLRA